jgi:glycosyltransferase involved in cell wall biosynthesis
LLHKTREKTSWFNHLLGIPDVLESYRLLRARMDSDDRFNDEDIPQLVICGHGSVDDPDGTVIYELTHETMATEPFQQIASDIVVARIPPSDQLLNVILRGAYVALQLSHREGFEVKVTEALAKGVPVIAYIAGGIPLQIIDNVTGYLVPISNVQGVADKLFSLFENPDERENMGQNAVKYLTEEYFTVWNSIAWLFMCNELTRNTEPSQGLIGEDVTRDRNGGMGDGRWLREFWQEKYQYKGKKHAKDVDIA